MGSSRHGSRKTSSAERRGGPSSGEHRVVGGVARRVAAGRFLLVVILAAETTTVRAQWRRPTEPVSLPAYSIVGVDSPEAVNLNPAALAALPAWGLSYVHADAGQAESLAGRGDAFYAAAPLLFGLSGGIAVDAVRPTAGSGQPARIMTSVALSYAPDETLSFGAASRFFASRDRQVSGIVTLDLAARWLPLDTVGVSLLARDIVSPPLEGTGTSVPRSFVLGTALRPTGDRAFTLDLAGALNERGDVGARMSVDVRVPFVGRALVAAELSDLGRSARGQVLGGLSVDWTMFSAGGGVLVGDGFEGGPGWYVSARVEGAERRGIPRGKYVIDLPVKGTGSRGSIALVRWLDRALHDDRIAGVVLRPRGSGLGLAYAQEVRLLLAALREADKRVVCHLTDGTGSEFYACAAADQRLLDPAGGIRLSGLASELFWVGELLQKLGIRADFVRIGAQKSAIEQYHNQAASPTARAQRERILDASYRRLVTDIAGNLEATPAQVAALIDEGPFLPGRARERGLVDGLADEFDMDEALESGLQGSYARQTERSHDVDERWGAQPGIGVVVVDGDIVDGDNVNIPVLGIRSSGGRTVARALDRMADDPRVRAIVLRVDSPGGSVLASDQIYRAIRRARRRKKVIASLGRVAASGGYYIAAAADEIWANPSTLTGSIGVWFGKVDFVPLGEMVGVTLETMGRGRRAGVSSLYRPFTADERALLARLLRRWYLRFLTRVAQGRSMTPRFVDTLGRGRVFTGDEALEHGLVDHLGGFGSALTAARRAAGLGADAPIQVLPDRPSSALDYVLDAIGVSVMAEGPDLEVQSSLLRRVAPELQAVLRAVFSLRQAGATTPMARLPLAWLPVER